MRVRSLSLIFWVVVITIGAHAQTFRGGVSGTVTDSSGAGVPMATVKLDSPSNGLTRSIITNEAGQFSFPELPVGLYTITVSNSGFETTRVNTHYQLGRVLFKNLTKLAD